MSALLHLGNIVCDLIRLKTTSFRERKKNEIELKEKKTSEVNGEAAGFSVVFCS